MARRTDPLSRKLGLGLGLLALAVLEVAWLGWFLAEPLPNVQNVGGNFRHWMFTARALPHVIPGVRVEQSYLGLAMAELSHVENLPRRLPIVIAAGLIGAAAVALGELVLRALGLRHHLRICARIPLAYGLGTTGLGLAALLTGRLGGLAPWPVRIGLIVPLIAEGFLRLRDCPKRHATAHADLAEGGWDSAPKLQPRPWFPVVGFALIVGPFLGPLALGAMLPTIDFDAIEYHLQGPKEYYQSGRIAFLPHNVYTSMPFSVEMLHLLGMEVLDDWWWGALVGQLLVAAFAPASAALIAVTASRGASPRAGWIAAAVYLTTPWIYRLGVLPYVEGPLCYYHAALIWAGTHAFAEADPRARSRLWGVAGLLAGGAMACKYPALISAVIPFGGLALLDAVRRRSWRILATYCLGWAIVMAPWLGKNVIDTGNPVYPLGYHVFGGRHWSDEQETKWQNVHGRRPLWSEEPAHTADARSRPDRAFPDRYKPWKELAASIVDVAGRSDWQSPLYVALAPLALLRKGSRRLAWVLWGFVAYIFLTWWLLTHRLDRFWLPLLVPLAVLAGLGSDALRGWFWTSLMSTLLGVTILTNLAYITTAAVGLNEWTGDLEVLRRDIPARLNAPLARLDDALPPDAKVLLVGQAAVFHFRHPIVYNTVFNQETIEILTKGKSRTQIRQALADRGVTDVYVDWFEIERYRSPGNYGFTDYVTPQLFAALVRSGVLETPRAIGLKQDLYRVRGRNREERSRN